MRYRNGFVSNSSTSSFVVAKAVIGDEAWDKLMARLDEMVEAYQKMDGPYRRSWGGDDGPETYDVQGDYAHVGTFVMTHDEERALIDIVGGRQNVLYMCG